MDHDLRSDQWSDPLNVDLVLLHAHIPRSGAGMGGSCKKPRNRPPANRPHGPAIPERRCECGPGAGEPFLLGWLLAPDMLRSFVDVYPAGPGTGDSRIGDHLPMIEFDWAIPWSDDDMMQRESGWCRWYSSHDVLWTLWRIHRAVLTRRGQLCSPRLNPATQTGAPSWRPPLIIY